MTLLLMTLVAGAAAPLCSGVYLEDYRLSLFELLNMLSVSRFIFLLIFLITNFFLSPVFPVVLFPKMQLWLLGVLYCEVVDLESFWARKSI